MVPSKTSPGQGLGYKGTVCHGGWWPEERLLLAAVCQRAALPPRCAPGLCPVAEAKVFPADPPALHGPLGPLNPHGITERVGLRPRLAFGPHGILQGLRSPTSAAGLVCLSVFVSPPPPGCHLHLFLCLPQSLSPTGCSFPGVPFPYLLGSCWPWPRGRE